MKKTLLPLLVGASMLVPSTASAQNIQKSKEEITQTLSLDEDSLKMQEQLSYDEDSLRIQEQLRRQAQIQKLIPQIKEPIILWDLNQPNVAITIDDGYWVKSIEYMLDLFEKYDVKATFFVIWSCLKLHSGLWKKAVQQWHEICNHTMHHDKYFKTWNEPERFERELLWWEKAAKEVLWEDFLIQMKKNYPFFRFPWMYWIRVKAYLDILKKHGYIPIWWRYTENPKDGVVNNGEIFLWHFKDQDTLNVRKSLELIKNSGKHSVTVSDTITPEDYKPIWWPNLAEMKKKAQTKQSK